MTKNKEEGEREQENPLNLKKTSFSINESIS
jgi:hypothetical protein